MQSNTTHRRIKGFLLQTLMVLGLFCFMSSALMAQPYVNGNLSTGATSSNSIAAPAGFTWSEVQTGNTNAGFGAQIASGFSLADDFTVASGDIWSVNKLTFFAYSSGYTGATSPFTDLRFQIFNTDPSVGSPTPVFGNLTTNRLSASSTASIYRIFNATTGTTRKVWKLEANLNTVLPAGTYWIEWQTGVTGVTSNFTPPSTVVGTTTQPGNNAKQHDLTAATWSSVVDGTTIPNNFQDFHFIVDYSLAGLCAGTPDIGNTTSTATSVCLTVPFGLGVSNPSADFGITYQWQSSADGVTYSDIFGANNSTLGTSLTANTWYQLVATCSASGLSDTSTPVQVLLTPTSGCYCASSAIELDDEDIFNVTLGSLNNTSDCSSVGTGYGSEQNLYANYTEGFNAPAPAVLVAGLPSPLSVSIGYCNPSNLNGYRNGTAVWIDYDHSGTFEAAEKVYVTPQTTGIRGAHTETATINIPATATLGNTRMRVVNVEVQFDFNFPTPASIEPCGTYDWGETEDYLVNIRACEPVTISTQPVSTTPTCGQATFIVEVNAAGDLPNYQWQVLTSASGTWTNVVNGGVYSGANSPSLVISDITSDMGGNKYKVLVGGPCTTSIFSEECTLNPVITSQPSDMVVCEDQIADFSVTAYRNNYFEYMWQESTDNGTSFTDLAEGGVYSGTQTDNLTITEPPATMNANKYRVKLLEPNCASPIVVSVPSGTINLLIPDDDALGVSTAPLTISGIPAGAVITNVSVNFNLTHTYVGDLSINLVSPNGQILNLVGELDGGTGSNTSDNFTNTTISSTSANPLSGAPEPRTGTFEADALAGFGPTGSQQTVTDWTGLLTSGANGDWSLALADPWLGDEGTLNDWTISITYTASGARVLNSEAATLTVHPNPTDATISAAPLTSLYPGLFTTLSTTTVTPIDSTYTYQWLLNGAPISSATAATHVIDVDGIGVWSLVAANQNGCTVTSSNTVVITDSLNTTLFVYPNPSNGVFQVRYNDKNNGIAKPIGIIVYDSKGARVFSQNFTPGTAFGRMSVDLSKSPKGIYFIDVIDASGIRINTERVIVY